MTKSNPRYHIDFNVKFDEETDKKLEQLAAELHRKKSQIVREAIQIHHDMRFSRRPRCADGQECRMPQAHVWPTQPTPPDAPRPEALPHAQ